MKSYSVYTESAEMPLVVFAESEEKAREIAADVRAGDPVRCVICNGQVAGWVEL